MGETNEAVLTGRVAAMLADLVSLGADVPQQEAGALVDEALAQFLRRGVVVRSGDSLCICAKQEGVLRYYANSIAHHFDVAVEDAAFAK
jgi:glycerol-3-phosphate O-acyltransferase